MSEWKLRRTLQFERWRVDVNVSLPGSGEFCRYTANRYILSGDYSRNYALDCRGHPSTYRSNCAE